MARRRRKRSIAKRLLAVLLAVPALYLLAAAVGSLVAVNRGWTEASHGTTIFIVSNGVHADIIMPVSAEGLDWAPLFPARDFADLPPGAPWIAFGEGEERVYLETPRWRDIRARTIWSGLTGGKRVMHVEYAGDPGPAARAIRLRPEEYRRLWTAIRSDLKGAPRHIDHPGYGCCDAFYRTNGRASALQTCNNWVAAELRLAGVKTSLWSPFVQGLVWRYRRIGQST
ncbi:MAG: TIGR02117 family protein [Sphingomicrobium sp.]